MEDTEPWWVNPTKYLAPQTPYSVRWENRLSDSTREIEIPDVADYAPPWGAPDAATANPVVELDVRIGGTPVGTVALELRADVCPLTAENFRSMVDFGVLKGVYFHRVYPRFACQSGDFFERSPVVCPVDDPDECFDLNLVEYRKGGRSIYGADTTGRDDFLFDDENFNLKHSGPGVLTMATDAPDTNGSQFFITFDEAPQLDGRNVAFGQVIEGFNAIKVRAGPGGVRPAARARGARGARARTARAAACGRAAPKF